MKKVIKTAQAPRKGKKSSKSITTTSVAFKTKNLVALKAHDLHKKDDQSISWIINKLVEKLLVGGVEI